jgi:Fur family transcriptional regulator, ferric uptake regulator
MAEPRKKASTPATHAHTPPTPRPTPTHPAHPTQPPPSTADFLRSAGLRKTPVRVGVIDSLTRAARPLSAHQLVAKLSGVDPVTVYRTLNTFLARGIAHRIKSDDRSWLYALGAAPSAHDHKHPHFVCDSCGKVECMQSSIIPDNLLSALRVAGGYHVDYPEVLLHGTCPVCK